MLLNGALPRGEPDDHLFVVTLIPYLEKSLQQSKQVLIFHTNVSFVSGYAMTGFRLSIATFRKLNVWFGLWEKFPSNRLCPSWRRSVFCSCQASTGNYRRCLTFSPVKLSALRLSPEYISVLSLRNKSNKSSKRSRQTLQEEEEEEDVVEEESDLEDEFENDPNVVKDYKDLEKVVQSLRYDVIMKSGLDIARK